MIRYFNNPLKHLFYLTIENKRDEGNKLDPIVVEANKLFDGFDGKLNSSKWAKIAKCSPDTALRDIQDLLDKKILKKETAGGRSTNYTLKE